MTLVHFGRIVVAVVCVCLRMSHTNLFNVRQRLYAQMGSWIEIDYSSIN